MNGFFDRARKAVAAWVTAFIAGVLTAMQTGTVFQTDSGFGINWAAIGSAAVLAVGVAAAVYSAKNRRPAADGGPVL